MKNQLKRYISISSLLLVMFCGIKLEAQTATSTQNYVIESTVKTSGKKTATAFAGFAVDSVNRTITYYDGLGRPLQTVQWQGTPKKRDLVTPIAYDAFGREDKKYLPYSDRIATSNGSYKAAAIADQNLFYTAPGTTSGWASGGVVPIPDNAFSKTVFEASPLNRILEQGAPGAVWQPGSRTPTAGRSVITNYGINNGNATYASTTGFAVRQYTAVSSTVVGSEHLRTLSGTGYYGTNQLYLKITKDENWTGTPAGYEKLGTMEEYKDKDDRVVLIRTFNQVGATVQTLSTYYVYDDDGNLSFVLPSGANPDAVAVPTQVTLDNFCYQYRYDGRKRLIEKKLPGKGWEEIIYNKLDQVVFTADAVQRVALQRSFTKYDGQGHVIIKGVEKGHDQTRAFIQNIVDNQPILWESRDNAGFQGYTNVSNPMNHPQFDVHVVNYYDDYTAPGIPNNQSASYSNKTRGLLTASKVAVLGTTTFLWTVNYYDEEGRIARVWQQHYKGGVVATNSYDETTNTYNFAGELTKSVRRHVVAGAEKLNATNRFIYDHMGRLKETYQKTGDVAATTNPEVLLSRTTYNEIGQLSSKGLHSTNLTTFAQTINYNYNARGWLKSTSAPLFAEGLKYEEVIAGVISQYNGNISRQEWGPAATPALHSYTYVYDRMNRLTSALSDESHNEQLGYDLMGNISRLQRKKANTLEDQLKYTYTGNRLSSLLDSTASVNAAFQLSGTTAYTYDPNGNMTSRSNTVNIANNLASITYNHLNLPKTLTAGSSSVTYTYDANGTKLRKVVTGTPALNNDYISGIHYEAGVLKFITTAEGRVVKSASIVGAYDYEYTLTDHLGNGRVYFDINAGAARKIQEIDYYAFGLQIERVLPSAKNLYLYNGKEKQELEKLFDYGARFYDPVIGRWHVIDPMAQKFASSTPYNYVDNNPVLRIDPNGMEGTSTHTDGLGNVLAVYDDKDLGVYKHNDGKLNNYSSANTSAGGVWMQDTPYWDEFANHDASGNILGDKNGNFANTNAKINFGVSADESMSNKIRFASDKINSFDTSFGAKNWLQENSKRGESLDIKDKIGASNGYLFKGKYVSGESLGNYLFGANLASLRSFSNLDNLRYPFTNQTSVFYRAAEAFGAYHNKSNKVNNPSTKPYYGEIPYSGRQVTLGYYNNNANNAVFKGYPTTAIYGNKVVR